MSGAAAGTHQVYRDGHVVEVDNVTGNVVGTPLQRASELPRDPHGARGATALAALPIAEEPELVVAPVVSLERAKQLWTAQQEFREFILADPACADDIDGSREVNRTGATRLAIAFGLSIEERGIEEGLVQLADSGETDYRYRIRVRVSKGSRFVDNIGSCRLSEISEKSGDLSRREHFALTRAWTRATKRAIADILGGTEADQ
ncbi:MAG TPA: hypothetical protein VFF67_10355 [Thermoplasmata archaeon]|nr:hypothetical protein [Thermoplasmata archaeon]